MEFQILQNHNGFAVEKKVRNKKVYLSCKEGKFGFASLKLEKHLSRKVLMKRCFQNRERINRRTPMRKCDFNKVALQFY